MCNHVYPPDGAENCKGLRVGEYDDADVFPQSAGGRQGVAILLSSPFSPPWRLRRVKLSKNNVPKMRRVTGVVRVFIGQVWHGPRL